MSATVTPGSKATCLHCGQCVTFRQGCWQALAAAATAPVVYCLKSASTWHVPA